MLPLCLCLFLLLPQIIHTLQPPAYQSHSFNDLDYIVQQLIKGVDFFKIDVSMISKESCMQYSNWKEGDDDCIIPIGIEYCCLGFRGDSSSVTFLNDYFNTTSDFIKLLNSSRLDFILNKDRRDKNYNFSIKIAFTFENVQFASNMSKKFLYDLVSVIEDRNLDIILLGSAIDYYDTACGKTSVQKRLDQIVKNARCEEKLRRVYRFKHFYKQSDSFHQPDDRSINLNVEFPVTSLHCRKFAQSSKDIEKFCETGLPAYASKLPYLFYEVAHEKDIKYVISKYTSPKCKRATNDPPLQTLRVTSNIDTEMFEVFASDHQNYGINLANISRPRVEIIEGLDIVVFGYTDQENIRSFNQENLLEVIQSVNYPNQTLHNLKAHGRSFLAVLRSTLDTNNYIALHFNLSDASSNLISKRFQSFNSNYLAYDFIEGYEAVVTRVNRSTFVFTVYGPNLRKSRQIQYEGEIEAADVSISRQNNSIIGIIITEALIGDRNKLFSTYFTLDLQSEELSHMTSDSHIDFGSQPFVKLVHDENNELFVLEMHSNGMCQCGTGINNGNINKCRISTTDRKHVRDLQNTKYTLTYNWGQLSSFIQKIQDRQPIEGACDKAIMHGKFGNGEYPNGFVFRNRTTGELQSFAVNQNVEYADLPFVTKLFCGGTMPNYGKNDAAFRMQTFRILDYRIFKRLDERSK